MRSILGNLAGGKHQHPGGRGHDYALKTRNQLETVAGPRRGARSRDRGICRKSGLWGRDHVMSAADCRECGRASFENERTALFGDRKADLSGSLENRDKPGQCQ
jgi:hypothetical protein